MKKKLLFEDATMYYNKWVQGIAGKEFGTQRLNFKDIVNANKDHESQSPNTVKAGNSMPYPLPNTVSIFGDLIIHTSNALTMFKSSLKNPVVKNNKQTEKEIVEIINTLKRSLNELNSYFIKTKERVEKIPPTS